MLQHLGSLGQPNFVVYVSNFAIDLTLGYFFHDYDLLGSFPESFGRRREEILCRRKTTISIHYSRSTLGGD